MGKRSRTIYQIITLIFVNSYYLAFLGKNIPLPVFNCYACPLASFACPIGTLQYFLIIKQFPFLLLGILILSGILLGRYFCGWFCPFGALQDWLYRIKTFKIDISDRFSIYIRWIIFISLVIIIPYLTLEPWFCKLCPAGTLEAGIPQILINPSLRNLIGILFTIKIIILLLFFISSIFISRLFCRFICPLGTILSIFNKLSFYHLEVESSCPQCGICRSKCPVNIEVYKDPNSLSCIRCLECADCGKVHEKFTF
ncbi:MAG: 4Fe-4S binding protein [Dictyoglomaceae bacterium]|nr:4Fe-4S binding protein [Dictyoglomaceae bacterium]